MRRTRNDHGFSMIEIVVSMGVFTIILGALLPMLVKISDLARENSQRVIAGSLADKAVETVKGMDAATIPVTPVVRTEPVEGRQYTITQTSKFVADKSGVNLCADKFNGLAYKLVTVTVTWPDMGSVKPISMSVVKALGLGSDGKNASEGLLSVKVVNANGVPMPGVTVTLLPTQWTGQTGSDGCILYAGLTPASYETVVNRTGYVSSDGFQRSVADGLVVAPGQLTRVTVNYDIAGQISVTDRADGTLPAVPTYTLRDALSQRALKSCSAITQVQTCYDRASRQVRSVFPGQEEIWSGTCSDSRVGTSTVAVKSSATVAATVNFWPVTVVFVKEGAAYTPPVFYAVHAPDDGCPAGEVFEFRPTGPMMRVSLPAGAWSMSLDRYGTFGPGTFATNLGPGMESFAYVEAT